MNAQFLVNEVRKFVDNCIKTKDGIRFRKRYPHLNKMMNSNEMSPVLWLKDPLLLSTPSTTSLPCDPSHTSSCMIQPTQQQQQSQSPFEGMDEKLIKKNRPIVCDLILRFLRNNLNVDNSSLFRSSNAKLPIQKLKMNKQITSKHHRKKLTINLYDLK